MNLAEIARGLSSDPIAPLEISGVCIDSRKVEPGCLFVALKGQRVDGHQFIPEAIQRGAIAVLCEEKVSAAVVQLVVNNSLEALASMANHYRQKLTCPMIAVTGSNGKTTVKEMIAAILPKPSFSTQGNLNNHIGVPLSLLSIRPQHRYAVIELGANHLGEIAYTAGMVKPKVALINNIAPAHIAEFGSIERVAQTKGEIYQNLAEHGTAIVNDDDEYAHYWDAILVGKHVRRYSTHKKTADIYADAIQFNAQHCAEFQLHLPSSILNIRLRVPGKHSLANALAAAACADACAIDPSFIEKGLNSFSGVAGRLCYLTGKKEALIIDDTYNANLQSVLAAIEVLSSHSGKRVLVLGDLGELGEWTQAHHEEIGRQAQQRGIEQVLTCGAHSEYTSRAFGSVSKHYTNHDKLAHDLLAEIDKDTTILVKGSRSAGMEKIVNQLVE